MTTTSSADSRDRFNCPTHETCSSLATTCFVQKTGTEGDCGTEGREGLRGMWDCGECRIEGNVGPKGLGKMSKL